MLIGFFSRDFMVSKGFLLYVIENSSSRTRSLVSTSIMAQRYLLMSSIKGIALSRTSSGRSPSRILVNASPESPSNNMVSFVVNSSINLFFPSPACLSCLSGNSYISYHKKGCNEKKKGSSPSNLYSILTFLAKPLCFFYIFNYNEADERRTTHNFLLSRESERTGPL